MGTEQQSFQHQTAINGHTLSELGPADGGLRFHNNYFGFRISSEAELLGFQINYVDEPNTGQFYAFVYTAANPNLMVVLENLHLMVVVQLFQTLTV